MPNMQQELISETFEVELVLVLCAFILSAAIGLERQVRQKSAGLRTHALVGTGSATFTLVSAYGFASLPQGETLLDPSRIAAQVVSGIGFLGAGVIFTHKDVVRGLTTAATIWICAAIGMACAAGMVGLAVVATLLHFLTICVLSPLGRMLPSVERKRSVIIEYADGRGVLREILTVAGEMGFTAFVLSTRRRERNETPFITVHLRFRGKPPLRDLITHLTDISGVHSIRFGENPADTQLKT